MADPKICNKCCKYTDCFYANEAVCYNCEEPKIKRRQKDQSIDRQREKRIVMASRASKLFFVILMFLQGCVPLTTNSEAFINVQKNLELNAKNLVKVGKDIDKISDKLGLGLTPLESQFKDALSKQQADNDKKYDLLDAKLTDALKQIASKTLEAGGQAMGIPAPITAGVIGLVSTYGGKMVSDIYARRKEERTAQEHAEALADAEEEAEKERQKLQAHHDEKIAGLKHHMEIIKRCNPAIFEEMANAEKKAKADGVI